MQPYINTLSRLTGLSLLDKVGAASEYTSLFETESCGVALNSKPSSCSASVLVLQVCATLHSLEQTFPWNTFCVIKDKFKYSVQFYHSDTNVLKVKSLLRQNMSCLLAMYVVKTLCGAIFLVDFRSSEVCSQAELGQSFKCSFPSPLA